MSTSIQRDGRTWQVNSTGISSLKRRYALLLSTNNLGPNGEIANLAQYGIPAIGSKHPSYDYLVVSSYDVEEGEGNEKKVIYITVSYSSTQSDGGGSGEDAYQVEEYGWDSSTSTIEVVNNLFEGQSKQGPLLNSAGDPFDSVPTVESPTPVFTKVMKTKQLKSTWLSYNCKLNKNTVDAAGFECAPNTLLANVAVSRIFGDPTWKWRYTVQLRYKSNLSMLGLGTTPIQFGWDIPVVDTGMRQLVDGKPQTIMSIDEESKMPSYVTSPELLDGSGKKASRDPETNRATPYIIRVQAYETDTLPSDFYSAPVES